MSREEVTQLRSALDVVSTKVHIEFGSLNSKQLNWRPSAERWSVAQCLDHLINGNRAYFPLLEAIVKREKKTAFIERLPVLPGLWGKLLIRTLNPKNSRKLKAPSSIRPASSDLPSDIVGQFLEHQAVFSGWLDETKDLDLERIIITSPVAKFVTYSVMDSFRFLVLHEERHFQQAQRVVAEEQFPK
jgi:hypothetical protein